ncbi:Cyclic-AMP phosphodiesterase class-II [Penicillium verhagenii]|uniref:Cyclic-AMP phosphodiesterase class-II n=1 Tax=Penicillium verhagenii TaxID=1562060 RepID=UPI002544E78F|nr:Cyclic-AMP phosphodiesterase class-II [Penicillium verhagenii]KAJ5948130.1 Cyclic-AMP phosphodiesterase class-II [Penicillium verhagenii]
MANSLAFEVIVLGPTGGPREDQVTGLLVRSKSTNWAPGSVVAVDAGTMLAGIIRALKPHIPFSKYGRAKSIANTVLKDGPFKGLNIPNETAEANAAHIFREIIGAFLITHPHLDHVSGLAINTPIIEAGSGPKPVAALPSVLAAIKNHVFNDVIWPNLSDEDGGAGLLTYQRLVEGGNPRFGNGDSRGYVRACLGIVTKCLSVSHGRCKKRYHPETGVHHRAASNVFHTGDSRRLRPRAISVDHSPGEGFYSPVRSPHLIPGEPAVASAESSAFFLRDHDSGNEIIVFGDVEPDSVSLEPRNRRVWETAAPKIASGKLRTIFIECSYTDGIDDAYLYGHLCPRHLIAELTVLADLVMYSRDSQGVILDRKRKRPGLAEKAEDDSISRYKRTQSSSGSQTRYNEPLDGVGDLYSIEELDPPDPTRWANIEDPPLGGLSVYIIHIKETLKDGSSPGIRIIEELTARSDACQLGCKFFLPNPLEAISC